MALSVAKPKAQQKLVVVRNYGMQGNTYNPQQTASPQITYNPQQTYNPQKTSNPQAAAVAAAVARYKAAAEAQAAAIRKEQLRVQVQGQINNKVSLNTDKFKLQVASPLFQNKLTVGKSKNVKFKMPEQTEYEKEYQKQYEKALADFNKQRQPGKKNLFQTAWDKLSGGQDRRDVAARQYAEAQANKINKQGFKTYETKLNKYLKKQATVQAAVNRAALTMTQSQFDAYVKSEQAKIDKEYQELTKMAAGFTASMDAYDKSSKRPLTSFLAKATTKLAGTVQAKAIGKIFQYTLGAGSRNLPSIVTAPSRIVNTIGNLNTNDRQINKYGGETANRKGSKDNAWQASFNQRNFNIKPVKDQKFDKNKAYKELSSGKAQFSVQNQLYARRFKAAKTEKEKQKIAEEYWKDRNRVARNNNSAKELFADPLIPFSGGLKAAAKVGLAAKFLKTSKTGQLTTTFKNKVAENKAVQWLAAEHKNPQEKFFEARNAARDLSRQQQTVLLDKVVAINKKLEANPKYDLSIFDDLKSMSPSEIRVLQRMSGDAKFKLTDRVLLAGNKAARTKLETIAKRYIDFTEKMKLVDAVEKTRYGRGKKMYSPRTVWDRGSDLANYDFRRRSRGGIQSADDFLHGVTDRFFKSDLNDVMTAQGKNNVALKKELSGVWDEYGKSFSTAQKSVAAAKKQYNRDTTGIFKRARNKPDRSGWKPKDDVSVGRATLNSAKSIQAAPMKIWKASVLKLRPAWTVNNVLYNTQAAVLAGGRDALKEQAKMVSPRYWRKAMDESRSTFGSNIGKEIGTKGRLNRFYTGVEDWSRVAAGRAALKKGYTEKQAVKRVNKYLYDYKTRNIERPIKTVIPFWHWNKNLTKAAVQMPLDRPGAAIAYSRTDRYQNSQFDTEFKKVAPELKKLGYTDAEIEKIKNENSGRFKGRLKIGDRWFNTPFNAFSDKGLTQFGLNPFIATGAEVASAKDNWGKEIGGNDASFLRRLITKFPQVELGRNFFNSLQISKGKLKPTLNYIGKEGSEGYGMGKTKQGFDPKKQNYRKEMDPRNKLTSNATAFLGVPSSIKFDAKKLIETKRLQKITAEYFKLDTSKMEYEEGEAARQQLFKKYGITPDEFYKGVLGKYDSDNTLKIKKMKEDAKLANDKLFDEYGKQPYGTRAKWAAQKMKELNDAGYFDDNPFLSSFVKSAKYKSDKGWLTPTIVAKQQYGSQKKADYEYAKRTGDWSKYNKKYGTKQTQKSKDYQLAKRSGNWAPYFAKYGRKSNKQSPFQADGKYFKSAESMARYQEGKFWQEYENATPEQRKELLAKNPKYNKRSNWTAADWLAEKKRKKAQIKQNAKNFAPVANIAAANKASTEVKATRFRATLKPRNKKVVFAR